MILMIMLMSIVLMMIMIMIIMMTKIMMNLVITNPTVCSIRELGEPGIYTLRSDFANHQASSLPPLIMNSQGQKY